MRNWFVWPDEDFPRTSTLEAAQQMYIQQLVVAGWQRQSWEINPRTEEASLSPLAELVTRVTGMLRGEVQPARPISKPT